VSNPKTPCPNCGGRVKAYGAKVHTDAVKVIYYACQNSSCLLRFTSTLALHELVTPPIKVVGDFTLRQSQWTHKIRETAVPP
jgi:Ogr/Delta-like zinc finger